MIEERFRTPVLREMRRHLLRMDEKRDGRQGLSGESDKDDRKKLLTE